MNREAIGAVGEVVAALGVILSLLYLASVASASLRSTPISYAASRFSLLNLR